MLCHNILRLLPLKDPSGQGYEGYESTIVSLVVNLRTTAAPRREKILAFLLLGNLKSYASCLQLFCQFYLCWSQWGNLDSIENCFLSFVRDVLCLLLACYQVNSLYVMQCKMQDTTIVYYIEKISMLPWFLYEHSTLQIKLYVHIHNFVSYTPLLTLC